MPNDNDPTLVEIDGLIQQVTERGVRVQISIWLPLRYIEWFRYADGERSDEPRAGRHFKAISIAYWIAKAKGLIDARQAEAPQADDPGAFRVAPHIKRRGA